MSQYRFDVPEYSFDTRTQNQDPTHPIVRTRLELESKAQEVVKQVIADALKDKSSPLHEAVVGIIKEVLNEH